MKDFIGISEEEIEYFIALNPQSRFQNQCNILYAHFVGISVLDDVAHMDEYPSEKSPST